MINTISSLFLAVQFYYLAHMLSQWLTDANKGTIKSTWTEKEKCGKREFASHLMMYGRPCTGPNRSSPGLRVCPVNIISYDMGFLKEGMFVVLNRLLNKA